jgi:RNA recognition motif-containing protein
MHLLISNMNKFTTMPQVIALFIPFGVITSAHLVCNDQNGISSGEALVEIEFSAGRSAIKALNNLRFMNYFIKVEEI